jgi:hypothetical protein
MLLSGFSHGFRKRNSQFDVPAPPLLAEKLAGSIPIPAFGEKNAWRRP